MALLISSFADASTPRLPKNVLKVPIVRQSTTWSCGAAAFLGVLSYWKAYDGTESSLFSMLETTPEQGTEPQKLRDIAKDFGLESEMKENMEVADLQSALRRGATVILAIQAWRGDENASTPWKDVWEEGHYVVLIGLDKEFAYVMDPSVQSGYVYVPINELLDRWHDYEDRHGTVWRYQRLGVIIYGKSKPLPYFPGPLVRMG